MRTFASEAGFPNMHNFKVLNPTFDLSYNCVGWAVDDTNRWWWPIRYENEYWPFSVENSTPEVKNFDELFIQNAGAVVTNESPSRYISVEPGFVKLALFTADFNHPTHIARQMDTGKWVSKLGGDELLEHELDELEGGYYGTIKKIYKVPILKWKRIKLL